MYIGVFHLLLQWLLYFYFGGCMRKIILYNFSPDLATHQPFSGWLLTAGKSILLSKFNADLFTRNARNLSWRVNNLP